jgi:hypothetical protein
MANFAEVEKLALELSAHERARLAAKLIESLPEVTSGHDDEQSAGEFITLNSSMVRGVRYDPENKILDAVFRNGDVYRYKSVPSDEYERFMKADSYGKYMQRYIIDHYDTVKIQS